jgi:hypothetical protein
MSQRSSVPQAASFVSVVLKRDNSATPNGEFVLAGHIASDDPWARFLKEWDDLLPFGVLAENGKYHFKMSQMAATPERMERVPAFYWVIEKYVLLSDAS